MARRFAQKKQLFDEPDEKSDDVLSDMTTKVITRSLSEEYITRKVISAVENSIGEN